MSKLTKKEQIMQFVESKGSATFTEIQRFIVDLNHGEGTYDAAKHSATTWNERTQSHSTKCNPYRGYYCDAFFGPNPSLMGGGKAYLEKGDDGKYIVVRVKNGI